MSCSNKIFKPEWVLETVDFEASWSQTQVAWGTPLAAEGGPVLLGTVALNLRSLALMPELCCHVGKGGIGNSLGVGVGCGVGMRVGMGLRVRSLG